MTKQKALMMMLEIINECQTSGGSCRNCAFSSGPNCMASAGNDVPENWHINDKVYEWTRGKENE